MNKKLYPAAVVLFIGTLVLYILTLHPFFPLGDSGEFLVVAKIGGVAHPPGFPLYTLISFLVASLKIGSLVTRLNILSAIFGALAAATTFLLVYEITKSFISSLFAGLILSVSHLFWLYSIIPEVYTLSIFLNILILLLFAKWLNNKNIKFLYLLSFAGGLSVSVHYVNFFTLFLVALFSLPNLVRKFFKLKNISTITLSFFLGLIPLLSIPIVASNNAFLNWGNIQDISGFLKFIFRSDYQSVGLGESFNYPLSQSLKEQLPFLFGAVFNSFGAFVLLVPLAFWPRNKQVKYYFLFILCNFIILGPLLVLFLNYPLVSPFPDVAINHKRLMQQFHILSFPYIAILSGLGVNNLLDKLRKCKRIFLYRSFLGLLSGTFLIVLFSNYQKISSARNLVFKTYGENILKEINEPTILITGTEESNILNYFYAIEGIKKEDIRLINFSLMQNKWYVDQLKERYTDVYFPFDNVIVGEKLDAFYDENLKNFSIIFAPLDGQAFQSVPGKFSFIPYGLTVELVEKESEPDKQEFIQRNKKILEELGGKNLIFGNNYVDEATNENLMTYARAFTNVGLKSNKLGDSDSALFFLDKAQKVQPGYYTSNLQAASIYIDKNDLLSAIKEYEEVLKVNPKHTNSLRNLAVLYFQLNNKYKALEYAKKYQEEAKTNEEKKDAQEILLQISLLIT